MNKEEYLQAVGKNVEEILQDYLFGNYKKQIMAWRLSPSFNRTYDEAYLWNRCLYLSSSSGILLIDTERNKLAIRGLKESAETYEYLSQISEHYDKEYALLLASLCYDIAGYQANALCLTKTIIDYEFSSDDDQVDVSSDNYIIQHVKQILLKNIVKARTNINTDLNIDLGLRFFNGFISKWYEHILYGSDNDFLSALQTSYQYYLNTSNTTISHLLFLLKVRLYQFVERSIWKKLWEIETINGNPFWVKYVRLLAQDYYANNRIKDIDKRVSKFEFWTSQLRAIEKGILSSEDNFVIQMPTSTGKTFIAELSILNHLVKNPGKKCIYIAPFRALSNEKELELSNYLSKLGYSVSALSGSYELDEFQQIILDDTDILVATPEKIDLLYRLKPAYFNEVSLIVVDEGQIVGDISARASLTEFLIIRLKMKLASLKILFVSAVMPSENADEYSLWISNTDSNVIRSLLFHDSPRDELWEPTRKIIGRFNWDGENGRIEYRNVEREDEESRTTSNAFIPYIIKLKQYANKYPDKSNKAQTSASLGFELSKNGSCLIFCAQVRDTERVGVALLNIIKSLEEAGEEIPTYLANNTDRESYFFSSKWFGVDSHISQCLERGIGIHFGDMPEPVRRAVESDYKAGLLKILISTSTVGQGLNFPIKNLIIHSTILGFDGHPIIIKVRDFWNIIGRAGRAGQETEGQVIFVIKTQRDYLSYLHLTDRANIEPANSMFFNVLDAFIKERIDKPTYDTYLQILSEPYLLSLLVEETLDTEDEEVIEQILNNSLFKIQAEKYQQDLQPLRDSFSSIIASINEKVPERELVKVYGTTGFNLSSNQAIDQYIEDHKQQLTTIVAEDNYIELLELILKLVDNGDIDAIEESYKLKNIGLKPSEYLDIIKLWIDGQEIETLQAEWRDINDDINKLNVLISDGLYYRYTWAFTAFITILAYKLNTSWDDLPEDIKNLPGYIKFGANNPTACLARSLGIKNRDIALLLSVQSNGLSGRAFISWLANLTTEDLETFDINKYDAQNVIDVALRINPNKLIGVPQSYSFNVRGIPYAEERIQASMILEIGNHLLYKRDTENLYDPYAIKIFYEERELGFVPREYSKYIATEIDLNNVEYEIVIRNIEPIRNYQNIEVNMYAK